MFGKNAITKQIISDGKTLLVNSIFLTVQGEGPAAGTPAVFIRLSKCCLKCYFCDTEFESGTEMAVEAIVKAVRQKCGDNKVRLVVITGGEPFVQNLEPLVMQLVVDYAVQIETSGALWLQPGISEGAFLMGINAGAVQIVVSPKTGKVHPKIESYAYKWKYIVRKGETSPSDGLPCYSTQSEVSAKLQYLARPPHRSMVYVQPMDEQDAVATKANIEECIRVATKYGYRISLQQHKIMGIE